MSVLRTDLMRTGLAALLPDLEAMGVWEYLGRLGKPISAAELAELRRRFNALVEYTELLAARYTSPAGEPPPLSNYAATFRVGPVAKPCLPHPRVVFVKKGSADAQDDREIATAPGPKLSRREWDVALALTRGLTQAKAGAELGVRQRAELVSRLQALGTPPAAE